MNGSSIDDGFVSIAFPRSYKQSGEPMITIASYKGSTATVFALNTRLMQKIGWMIGDRVNVLVNHLTQRLCLRRCGEGETGWKISGGKKGTSIGGHVRVSVRAGVPFVTKTLQFPPLSATPREVVIQLTGDVQFK